MNVRRFVAPALLGIALIHPSRAVAQRAGAVELGGFLQLDRLHASLLTKRIGGGAGGRAGVFIWDRWQLEGEASYSQSDPEPSRVSKAQINYFVGRLNYNVPWGAMAGNAVILSAGAGQSHIDRQSDLVLSPAIGLRAMLANALAIRFDVASMIVPNAKRQFVSPGGGVGTTSKSYANYQARAGLSLLLGAARKVEPVVPIREAVVVDNREAELARARRDSIDRANRLRQDSIDAANRARAARAAAARAIPDARSLINAPIYFDYDQSEIRGDARDALDAKLPLLRANPAMRIRIEGNTDARGSNEYNIALGLRRANAARRYLVAQGIDNTRFDVVSYGEERSVDQGTTEAAYAKNRRDDFVITIGGDDIRLPL
ncbi:MAG: peptidoglycan-associated lipoprotein [Gemmatimonadetes bacterium]|nr:peptidoglycan-associated lipoprotein [Gemmatimonadota bacterium]